MVITMKLWISREQTGQKQKRLKIAAIVLAVLLTVSAGGLASRYIYLYFFAPTQSTVTVPDNLICEKPELPSGEKLGAWEREKEAAQIDESEAAEAAGSAGLQKEAEGGSSTLTMPKAAKLELYAGKPEINREFDVRNMYRYCCDLTNRPNGRYPFPRCKTSWQTNAADCEETPCFWKPLPVHTRLSYHAKY